MKFDITFIVRILIRKMNCKKVRHFCIILFMFLTTLYIHTKYKHIAKSKATIGIVVNQ